jgi:hypothetical protein
MNVDGLLSIAWKKEIYSHMKILKIPSTKKQIPDKKQ